MKPLRIAMLTHSTNPRGGVVHALELAEALHGLGQSVTLMAAAEARQSFFRATECPTRILPLPSMSGDLTAQVALRIEAYIKHFSNPNTEPYDIYHAQDSISGCALAKLVERGVIGGFVRTVHHLDQFADTTLMDWQARSFQQARQVLCVSRGWRKKLAADYGIAAFQINNGVNTRRYQAEAQPADEALCQQLGLNRDGPVFLVVGGVEARKNTLRILIAFTEVLKQLPQAQLLIVGGASLLDHSGYRQAFDQALADSGLPSGPGQPVYLTGPLPDEAIPGLFRLADALVFPSLAEGFGLVVLEAIASGTPVIVSRIEPFTDYLREHDCLWANPQAVESIASGMVKAVTDFPTASLPAIAQRLSTEYSWEKSAHAHLQIYQSLLSTGASTHA